MYYCRETCQLSILQRVRSIESLELWLGRGGRIDDSCGEWASSPFRLINTLIPDQHPSAVSTSYMGPYHLSLLYQNTMGPYHLSSLYHHTMGPYHLSLLYHHTKGPYHLSSSYHHTMGPYHLSLLYQNTMGPYHLSSSYHHTMGPYHLCQLCSCTMGLYHLASFHHETVTVHHHNIVGPSICPQSDFTPLVLTAIQSSFLYHTMGLKHMSGLTPSLYHVDLSLSSWYHSMVTTWAPRTLIHCHYTVFDYYLILDYCIIAPRILNTYTIPPSILASRIPSCYLLSNNLVIRYSCMKNRISEESKLNALVILYTTKREKWTVCLL